MEFEFGYGPFVEGGDISDVDYNTSSTNCTKLGGDVAIKSNTILRYIVVGLLIFIILYIVYKIIHKLRWKGEDYNQRRAHAHFNNLHGEEYDEDAKNAIRYGEAIENPRAIDHYRIGTTYLVNAHNPRRAYQHFRQALHQVINGEVELKEAPFILDRIDDYKDFFMEFPDIEELPLQQALMAHYDARTNMNQQLAREKPEIREDDPEFTQKIILARQEWQSDSQNVHDSAVYEELREQFFKIREENAKIPNAGLRNFNEVSNWLKVRYEGDTAKSTAVSKVLDHLNNNYSVTALPGVREQDIIVAVWKRAYDQENTDRFNDIREAIGDAVLDCIEGGSVVCMSGRTSKIWQALAKLDKDPQIGTLKTKQVLRNEIYELSAKIVDDYAGKNGSASEALKEAYARGENTEQVNELIETMKQQISDLRPKYEGLLPKEQLDLTLEECKSVI